MTAPSDTPLLSKAQILLDLAASCERERPSREIDCHIAFFVTGDLQVGVKGPLKAPLPYMLSEAVEHPRDLQLLANDDNIDMIPRYTSSLDAAVKLVPEGCTWIAYGPAHCMASASVGLIPDHGHIMEDKWTADGETPALALCAAALRARAALEGGKDE